METVTLTVSDNTQMLSHVARPEGTSDKGIIIIQEAFGVTDYIRSIVGRFAQKGYLAIAPEMFHRSANPGTELSYSDFPSVQPHMQALTIEGQTADLAAANGWLLDQGIAQTKIASLGFCMGGRASFLANATLPLACAVSFYGGGIAEQLLDRAADLSGPQMLFWGGKDDHITPEQTRKVSDALRAAGKPFVEAVFSEAGHAFARTADDHYHESSAKEAWALADAFLGNHLG